MKTCFHVVLLLLSTYFYFYAHIHSYTLIHTHVLYFYLIAFTFSAFFGFFQRFNEFRKRIAFIFIYVYILWEQMNAYTRMCDFLPDDKKEKRGVERQKYFKLFSHGSVHKV